MQPRSKLLSVGLAALLALTGAVFLVAGQAAAAEWHAYEGDIHPGHAYGLAVPNGADALEFAFQGAAEGAARFTLFDPAGALVGHYELSQSPSKATIASPVAGRYVAYVYEVSDGGFTLRVSAAEAPALKLSKIALAREDITLKTVESPEALDEVVTVSLAKTPVFVTLLYQGSASDLDASVASTRGVVATVTDETATAFSPGVWSAQSGTRTSDPANLASGAYTVTLQAAQFQGKLVLTSLALDLSPPEPPVIEKPVPEPIVPPTDLVTVQLNEHEALAMWLTPGPLTISDLAFIEHEAEADEDARYRSYGLSEVLVYTPDDVLFAVVTIDRDTPTVELDIPEAGEWVLFTSRASHDILAQFHAKDGMMSISPLELAETTLTFETGMMLGSDAFEFDLEHVPVAMRLVSSEGFGALASAAIENEHGVVLSTTEFVQSPFFNIDCPHVDAGNFAMGAHELQISSVTSSTTYELTVVHYVRHVEIVETAMAHVTHSGHGDHDEHEGDEEAAPETPAEPEEEEESGFVDQVLGLLPF